MKWGEGAATRGALFLLPHGYLSLRAALRTVRAVVPKATFILLLVFSVAGSAGAQDTAAPSCPPGNLIAGATPSAKQGVRSVQRLTNDLMASEGDPWESDLTAIFNDSKSQVTYDLGRTTRITAIDLQGDNNDDYIVEVSDDGQTFTPLWTGDPVSGQGMRRRGGRGLDGLGRYVRVRAEGGDGFFSLSEVQVYCETPAKWPPEIKTKSTMVWWLKNALKKRNHLYRFGLAFAGLLFFVALFRSETWKAGLPAAVVISLGMLVVAGHRFYNQRLAAWFAAWGVYVLGALLLLWLVRGIYRTRQGADMRLWWERGALVCVMLASAAAWVNFGAYHNSRVVHYWDTFHYYVGSKYFEENEYDRLYECVLAADYEERGAADLKKRKIRDLVDNRLHYLSEDDAKRYQKSCAEHFSDARWAAFKQDTRSFRAVMGNAWWRDMLMDHGYNASPISNMVAAALTNVNWEGQVPEGADGKNDKATMSAFRTRVFRYTMIDLALYAGAFAMIFWAFGWRACALALLVWGNGYPWAYFWTGGSFARVPWFFMAVSSVCLLKKGYPLLSGIALAWSALLRLFPAALAGGPGAAIVDRFIRRKKIDRPWLSSEDIRFIGGGLLAVVLLGAASVAVNGGEAHTEFLNNTLKHAETPLTNHMGLPTLLSYRPSKVGRHTKDPSLEDPWGNWKQARKDTKHDRRWLHVLILAGMFVLLALAGRRMAAWAVLASSTILIVGFFELTCYYYSFAVLLAPIAIERLRYTGVLIGMVMAGTLLQFLIGWYDEQYVAETVVVLVAMLYIIGDIVVNPLPESSPVSAQSSA